MLFFEIMISMEIYNLILLKSKKKKLKISTEADTYLLILCLEFFVFPFILLFLALFVQCFYHKHATHHIIRYTKNKKNDFNFENSSHILNANDGLFLFSVSTCFLDRIHFFILKQNYIIVRFFRISTNIRPK